MAIMTEKNGRTAGLPGGASGNGTGGTGRAGPVRQKWADRHG